MKPIKVLFIHGGTLEKAGTEAYMMSVFRNVDPQHIHIDFLVFGYKEGAYDKEVLSRGSRIFKVPMSLHELRTHHYEFRTLKATLEAEAYDIAHAHMNALNYHVLKFMKRLGIKQRISHSHGSRHFVTSRLLIAYKERIKGKIKDVATVLIACSQAAGEFLYGETPYILINNGVDTARFAYNPAVRDALRHELQLQDALVLGHVGRFNFQKNHRFLIDIFQKIHDQYPQTVLMLVGGGELEADMHRQIAEYQLEEAVLFMGIREDIPDLLQVMDHFLMPSLFEGLPYVLIEAQTAGLQCFAADTIDRQSKLTDLFYFLPLTSPESWVQTVCSHLYYQRKNQAETIAYAGFAEADNVKTLVAIYEEIM